MMITNWCNHLFNINAGTENEIKELVMPYLKELIPMIKLSDKYVTMFDV